MTGTGDSVTVRGLVIREVTSSSTKDRAGVKVVNALGCRIEDNTLLDTFFGIYLSKVKGCLIREDRIRGSGAGEPLSGDGIHCWSSSDL